MIHTRGWAADSSNARARLQAEVEQAQNEVLLLGEEMRIKDARMAVLDPHRRPYYRCVAPSGAFLLVGGVCRGSLLATRDGIHGFPQGTEES